MRLILHFSRRLIVVVDRFDLIFFQGGGSRDREKSHLQIGARGGGSEWRGGKGEEPGWDLRLAGACAGGTLPFAFGGAFSLLR